jgi:hypothetical protein
MNRDVRIVKREARIKTATRQNAPQYHRNEEMFFQRFRIFMRASPNLAVAVDARDGNRKTFPSI